MTTKLEELKAAYEAASSGEWILFDSEVSEGAKGVMVSGDFGVDVCAMSNTEHVGYENNDKFIALAHNLMPQLLEAVEVLRELREVGGNEHRVDEFLEKLK